MKWFTLRFLVLALSFSVPAYAQAPTVKLADLVGTWEKTADLERGAKDTSMIYRRLVFESDSFLFWSTVTVDGHDTLATFSQVNLIPETVLKGDTVFIRPLNWYAVIRSEQLVFAGGSFNGPLKEAYTRVASPKQPFDSIIVNGFRSGIPVPVHRPAPTGTVIDLVGAWERTAITTPNTLGGPVRQFLLFRQDSTILDITYIPKKKVASAYVESWKKWKRLPNDSIISKDDGLLRKAVLQGQRLTIYNNGLGQAPTAVYEAVDDLPKQP